MEGMDETKTEGINVLKNKGTKKFKLSCIKIVHIPFLNKFHLSFRFLDHHWME